MPERLAIAILGVLLAACALSAVPIITPSPSLDPSASPTASPSGGTGPIRSARPARPTATPKPSASPDAGGLEALDLVVIGCPGGVVLEWSPSLADDFHHYTALRSAEDDINAAYPPIAPAVDWGDTYATDRFVTSAVDASLVPTDATWRYRVMAYDELNRPVSASAVARAQLEEVVELGPLEIESGDQPGSTVLDWTRFDGEARCFSAYRILVGPPGSAPATTLSVISGQGTTRVASTTLHRGEAYAIRVEAIRSTTLGTFVVGRTQVAIYAVP
jgi:hypothetical protein